MRAALLVLLAGCAAGPKLQPARITQLCPAVPAQPAVLGGYTRAFVEIASVQKARLPRDLRKLRNEAIPAQVAGVLIEDEVPEAIEWNRCLSKDCALFLKRMVMVSARLPSRADQPLKIAVLVREGVGEHNSVWSDEVETRDQTAVTLAERGHDGHAFVLTPYLIAEDADLKILLACKQAQGSK